MALDTTGVDNRAITFLASIYPPMSALYLSKDVRFVKIVPFYCLLGSDVFLLVFTFLSVLMQHIYFLHQAPQTVRCDQDMIQIQKERDAQRGN